MKRAVWFPVYCLILAMVLWASSFIALKLAFRAYHPMVVIFGRMLTASIFFAFLWPRFRSIPFNRRDAKFILLMAFCEPCLYFLFEAKAIQNTTASQAGMITAILPLMVAVAAHFVLKERIGGRTLAGFFLAIFGACWLSVGGRPSADAPNPVLGNFLEFMAMVCATGYTITLKRLTPVYPPLFLTGIQAFVGTLFFLPFLFLPATTLPDSLEPIPAAAIFYLGAVITLGAYGLYNFGVSRIPASQASAFVNLIPVFTVLLGWLILGETLTMSQCAAAVVVFMGVMMSQKWG
ncbi:MAG: DMT family transporter [Thermodesulfobacteriota bacterium]